MELSGPDFGAEKAIIPIEIYRKDEWRITAVAKGFNGGLTAFLAARVSRINKADFSDSIEKL